MRTWTAKEITGALNWLGHGDNFHLAMLHEALEGLPGECLDGDEQAQVAIAYLQRLLDSVVPEAVMEALIAVWSQGYAGRVEYELPAAVRRLAEEQG